jgi:hypothetical protein
MSFCVFNNNVAAVYMRLVCTAIAGGLCQCPRLPSTRILSAAGMGFCVFNNIAVAAAHALETRGLRRIAIVDYDVHHGNGTQVT